MVKFTKLGGESIYLNEFNIQWIEEIPDVCITLLGGARVIVREKISEVLDILNKTSESISK
jgi:flagellar protein FlbD